jgi:hypothetical protein
MRPGLRIAFMHTPETAGVACHKVPAGWMRFGAARARIFLSEPLQINSSVGAQS